MKDHLLALSVLALAAAVAFAAVRPAAAEAPRTAVCEKKIIGVDWLEKRAAWMNQQLAAGRTGFVFDGEAICAW